jgi:hypothetical protein
LDKKKRSKIFEEKQQLKWNIFKNITIFNILVQFFLQKAYN